MLWAAALAMGIPVREALITHAGPTDNLPLVMAEVGRRAGVKIAVQGAPERDWVYLQVKDRPLAKVLDLVAEATQAEWTEVAPGEYKIFATWPMKESGERRKAIQKWLDEHPRPGGLEREEADKIVEEAMEVLKIKERRVQAPLLDRLDDRTPLSRFLIGLLHDLGEERLSDMAEGLPVEFRIHPTGRAIALPAESQTAIDGLRRDIEIYAGALGRKGITDRDASGETASGPLIWQYAAKGAQDEAADWKITIQPLKSAILATITRIGADKRYGAPFAHFLIPLRLPASSGPNPFQESTYRFAWPSDIKPLVLSPSERAEALRTRQYSPALIARFRQCADQETLTRGFEAAYAALAEGEGVDVAAIVPDHLLDVLQFRSREEPTVSEVLSALYTDPILIRKDGALIVRSRHLEDSRRARIPRSAAGRVFNQAMEDGVPGMDALAKVMHQGGDPAYEWVAYFTRQFGALETSGDTDSTLRVLSILTPSQVEAARSSSGLSVPVGTLSLEARRAVEGLVFGSGSAVVSDAVEPVRPRSPFADTDASVVFTESDLRRAVLHVSLKRSLALFTSPVNPPSGVILHSVTEFASRDQAKIDEFFVASGRREILWVRVAFSEQQHVHGLVRASSGNRLLKWGRYADLDPSVRAAVEAEQKRIKDP